MSTMRGRNGTALLAAAIVLVIPLLVLSLPSNPPLGNTGAPGQGNCASCHGGGAGGGNVSMTFSGGGTSYTPGVPQTVTVTVTDPNASIAFGFETVAWEGATKTTPGTFAPVSANVNAPATSASFAGQIFARHFSDASNAFQFTWTPPAASVYSGPVVFYTASLAGDGSQGSADSLYQTSHTLTAATGKPNLKLSPTSLSYSYQLGGTVPAAKSVSVTSSGAALSFTATTSAPWITVTPASGSTPKSLSVGIKPSGLTVGTHTGTVTVTSSGAANSPQKVSVTLTVTAAKPKLVLTPASLSFSYKLGGTVPAAKSVSVTSSGAALSFTAAPSASWITVTPASGSTPKSLSVGIKPSGLTAGTHTGTVTVTSSGASNSPQKVTVTLVVTAAAASNLVVTPRTLSFSSDGSYGSLSAKLLSSGAGGQLSYTAEALGGSWLTVNPSGGSTPDQLTVTVFPAGLVKGSYTGLIKLSAPGVSSLSVPVTLTVSRDVEDSGDSITATTYTYDPSNTGAVAARWVHGVGVPDADASDPTNQGLVLSNNATALSKARAGVVLHNVEGITLNAIGFDLRQGSLCSAKGPRFIVVTSDNVVHTVGGCNPDQAQGFPAEGWMRFSFDPAEASPAIAEGSTVQSIALMLDDGPEAGGGMVVLDNINVNGMFIGHD